MTSWPVKPLASVATVGSGSGFPIAEQGSLDGEYAFLKVSDMNLDGNERTIQRWNNSVTEEVRRRLRAIAFPAGSVIFPKIGAAIATNKKRLLACPSCVDNNVMAVIPNPTLLDSRFLYFLLLTKNLSDFASDSNPPSIRKTVVEDWRIPVPPLAEQRRIIDLLSRAEGIVRLRREAQAKAAEIIPALFLDIFGDPATNPKRWEIAPLGDYIELLTGYAFKSDEFVAGGDATKLCRGANVLPQRIDWSDVRYWPNDRVSEVERFMLVEGDIVLAMDRPWISTGLKVARLAKIDTPALLVQRVARIRPKEQLLPEYVYASLCHARFASHCNAVKTETLVPHISPHDIRSYPIALVPLAQQRRFASLVEQVESILAQQGQDLVKAEATFQALLARAFSSVLIAATLEEEATVP